MARERLSYYSKWSIYKESMGSTLSLSSYIRNVDVFKKPSPGGSQEEQSVVYSTFDSRTCTLRMNGGVNSATVTLRDYTFDPEGTAVDIKVLGGETNNKGRGGGGSSSDVGTVVVNHHRGSALRVQKDGEGEIKMIYGAPRMRYGFLATTKHGRGLFVTHGYFTQQGVSVVVALQIWYDAGKRAFVCEILGPSVQSSFHEAMRAWSKAYGKVAYAPYGNVAYAPYNNYSTTTITRSINNTGGPFNGHLNGSMITDSIINFYNVFMNDINK